jgi:hypothetical protein
VIEGVDASIDENDPMRERKCIVTGAGLPEARLVRFALAPDGRVVPDVAAKLPGRGIWVAADREAIAKAVEKHLFARAAKTSAVADAALPGLVENRLLARMLDLIGLARRAGDLVLGFDKIETALRGPRPPAVLIEAADAGADGTRKLKAAAQAKGIYPFVIGCFSSAELGLALNLPNVVHASLKSGRLAEGLIFEAGRLAGFRPLKSWSWSQYEGRPENAVADGFGVGMKGTDERDR